MSLSHSKSEVVKFQFHCGTIKTFRIVYKSWEYIRFNSTVVRLKRKSFGVDALSKLRFQFHCGTIKTLGMCFKNYSETKFQFHCGTIKTGQKSFKIYCLLGFRATQSRQSNIMYKSLPIDDSSFIFQSLGITTPSKGLTSRYMRLSIGFFSTPIIFLSRYLPSIE